MIPRSAFRSIRTSRVMRRALFLAGLIVLMTLSAACDERPERAYERGVAQWSEGNYSAAVERLRAIPRSHPDSEQAPDALLRAARIQGRDLRLYEEAIATYQLLQALYPTTPQAREALEELIATRFRHTEDHVGVIIDVERYLDRYPHGTDVPNMYHFMIRSYLQLHEFERTRETAKRFLAQYPDHELADEVAYTVVRSFYVAGDNAKAVAEGRRQLEERADSAFRARTHFLLGGALEEMDRLQEALDAFRTALDEEYPAREVLHARMEAVMARMDRKYD